MLLESENIKMGTRAHDFDLPGIDGKNRSLKNFKEAKILVVVFMCNHCPYVQAVCPRLVALQTKYEGKGVRFVGINPNKNPEYPEENLEKMKEYADEYDMNFPYLLDETQKVAKAYKAQCTPDIYVFDENRELAYHGRVDDNWQEPEHATTHDLEDALKALVHGKDVAEDQHPSMGCSIKWLE